MTQIKIISMLGLMYDSTDDKMNVTYKVEKSANEFMRDKQVKDVKFDLSLIPSQGYRATATIIYEEA